MRAPPPPPGPDQISTARSAARSRLPSAFRVPASSAHFAAAPPGSVWTGPGGRADDDLRAAPPRLLDPEVDDRRALGDRVVSDDDHELRLADAGERKPEGIEHG